MRNFFKSRKYNLLRKLKRTISLINSFEKSLRKISNSKLFHKTYEFKERLKKGETLENLLPESYAVVKEASKRTLGLKHFDVQLLGGIMLNKKCIIEMQTGEGKTLTSTLSAYLNALIGKGVHIITTNEYLAKRDAENHRRLFESLNISIGVNLSELSLEEKKKHIYQI